MSWTTARELKQQVVRLWERGDLLRSEITGESRFPLKLALTIPTSAELTERFDAVRVWIAGLTALPHTRIEWREINHRVQGTQRLPQSIWVDCLEDALLWIGRRAEAARFEELASLTRSTHAALLAWLAKRPFQALELVEVWPQLLEVVIWMQQHPHPGIYLRQVNIAGVHSKFIEAHRSVLAEWFDLVLPASAIAAEHTGIRQFAPRYGFLDKPTRIRLRVLDPQIRWISGSPCPDITLDANSFAHLNPPLRRVFITENETNFLAFPQASEAIVIFGAGYGWEALSRATWLHRCDLSYWGDIDTHGFAILDQLRRHFPHTKSLLMDRSTLMAHLTSWGSEPDPITHDLPNLTKIEGALYDELRDNRIRTHLRLEQEMINYSLVEAAIADETDPGSKKAMFGASTSTPWNFG